MNVMMRNVVVSLAGLLLSLGVAGAEPATVDSLKQELQQMQQQMRLLQQKLSELQEAQPAPAAVAPPVTERERWSPAQPIPLVDRGPVWVDLSLVSQVVFGWSTEPDVGELQLGDHDPKGRGFSVNNTELVLSGAVDPYFTAFSSIVLQIDDEGDTKLELEEAWAQTTSLPANLQVRAGQMFVEFGRQNQQHAHAWDFVDQPLVLNRMFGPDGLRNPGGRISWLAPTPNYTELFVGVFNGLGETAWSFRNPDSDEVHGGEETERGLRGPQDLLFVPRIVTAFDLTDTQTLMIGASAALGPNNSGPRKRTEIYGADLYWKWRPVDAHQGFPFLAWQTEALYRRYEAAEREAADGGPDLPEETLRDWGFYSQLLWGFKPRWVAGLRGEFVSANSASFDSDLRMDRTRISPNLTWYPTEFSKVRLQYNYDCRQDIGSDHSVWLQLEFSLGAHGAHQF
jgi:hypothetical protein